MLGYSAIWSSPCRRRGMIEHLANTIAFPLVGVIIASKIYQAHQNDLLLARDYGWAVVLWCLLLVSSCLLLPSSCKSMFWHAARVTQTAPSLCWRNGLWAGPGQCMCTIGIACPGRTAEACLLLLHCVQVMCHWLHYRAGCVVCQVLC